ncbi:MAG TPA: hypothetical protein VMS17_01145 [Gemmataceae bacterium]|nr:hypothetical protein [Gemmataceae bacterium]
MTAVGKILVFFNLIFSLVVGAFVVYTYISQTHWKKAYDDLNTSFTASESSNQAYQTQLRDARDFTSKFNDNVLNKIANDPNLKDKFAIDAKDEPGVKVDKITTTLKAALDESVSLKKDVATLRGEVAAAKKTLADSSADLNAAQAEALKHQAEAKDARDQVATEVTKNLELVKAVGKAHDEQVAMKIKADAFELRAKELEKENDKLARDNQKLVASGVVPVSLQSKNGPNPPLESVEGLISEVDPSGLVRITIGSDAGLVKGNTLEVYRLNTLVPDQSKYVGRIKLIDVRNTEAVGQLMGKPVNPPQPGDTVSSRISGG